LRNDNTDKELVERLRDDDEEAIAQIFSKYYAYMCRSAYRILADENLAEDLAQEVFYELWKRRRELSVSTSLKAYLRRATVNKSLNYIRDHRKVRFEEEGRIDEQTSPPPASQRVETAELQDLIDKAIDELPDRCRIIFILSRFEDMTYNEIAGLLGISAKTVENQISKALRLLRQMLGPYLIRGLLALLGFWC
jgi:RNA polymerase sigma-70 factor (ECF subfamily)